MKVKTTLFKFQLIVLVSVLLTGNLINAQTVIDEQFNGTSMPTGWTTQATTGDSYETWTFYDDYDDVEINESLTTPQDEWLYSPSMDLSGLSNAYLSFSLWLYNKNNALISDTFDVSINVSIDNGLSWIQILDDDMLSPNDFTGTNFFYDRLVSHSLQSYCGPGMNNVKIGFHFTSTGTATSYGAAYLMDLKVSTDCPQTSYRYLNETTLKWFEVDGFSGTYDVEYGPIGFIQGTGTLMSGLSGDSYVLPASGCAYSAYIRTNCGAQQSAWYKNDFLNYAEDLSVTPSSNSATITWIGSSDEFDIEWGPQGFVVGTGTLMTNITGNTFTINGLSPNTAYTYKIRANCGGSNYGSRISRNFTTSNVMSVNEFDKDLLVSVYPNPSSELINIIAKDNSIDKIEVYDMQGRVVFTENVKAEHYLLNISKLQSATYTLKIFANNKIQNKLIIKN